MITIYRNGINVIGVCVCKDPPGARFYHEIHWHEYWYLQQETHMSKPKSEKANLRKEEGSDESLYKPVKR